MSTIFIKIEAAELTTEMVKELLQEAGQAGDTDMADSCQRYLDGTDHSAILEMAERDILNAINDARAQRVSG